MISNASVEDFKDICGALRRRAAETTHKVCLNEKQNAAARGMLSSSTAVHAVDRAAAETFFSFAGESFEALKAMNDAEPTDDGGARRDQLRALLEAQIAELASAVIGARNQHRRTSGLQNQSLIEDRFHEVVERAVAEFKGRIGLAATARGNRPTPSPAVIHSPTFHGSVANYQAGDHNTATVMQSGTQVSAAEAKAALDLLIQALGQASHIAPSQRSEVIEVLEQVKVEADKERPNRRSVGGLVGGVRDVLEGLQAAPGAWDTVRTWCDFIATSVT
ncbi:hypothetical protein [Roseateles asaccharophilus]|uniref:Uncharacterized protein n=1 Tax=Roseateles asaccharophilus TaxID=582607 RepID=A0ABU2A479_9BURK|nr:hypothetical protein [Roseateles asaccharophilus]MDR7332002.1 hypothetical protein [Roseateles asaccharophilus]